MPSLIRNCGTGLLLILLCGACSRFTVQSSYDRAARFSTLRTYAWTPGPQAPIGDPRVKDALVNATVRDSVDRELNAKGYAMASPDSADMVLAYRVSVDYKSSVVLISHSTVSAGGDWAGPRRIDSSDFEEGTIVLTISSAGTGKPIWRGVAAGIFDPKATREQREQRITAALHKLLKQFPPH
jgi:hypothetical protein